MTQRQFAVWMAWLGAENTDPKRMGSIELHLLKLTQEIRLSWGDGKRGQLLDIWDEIHPKQKEEIKPVQEAHASKAYVLAALGPNVIHKTIKRSELRISD